jgi:hypothetical protein
MANIRVRVQASPCLSISLASELSRPCLLDHRYTPLEHAIELRFAAGLPGEAILPRSVVRSVYAFAHSLDNASSANLGSVSNSDVRDQRFPNAHYGDADFDVQHRFVLRLRSTRRSRAHFCQRCFCRNEPDSWHRQTSGVFPTAAGNYYTAIDIVSVSNRDRFRSC